MKIIIASKGKQTSDLIDERFGRCSFFIVYDTTTGESEAFENVFTQGGGAGTRTAQFAAEKADAIIGINFGPNAFETLKAAGMKIYNGLQGKTIKENIDAYLTQKLKQLIDANVNSHNGLK